jgi:NADH-quinone oxidoreductase subunit M
MVLLTSLVTLAAIMFACSTIHERFASYAGWLLLSQAGLLIVFLSMDLLLFYLGFELALLPLLVLIARWSDGDGRAVGRRFVLFTLAGSIPMVVALIGIVKVYSTNAAPSLLLSELSRRAFQSGVSGSMVDQAWIFWMLFLGLGIKVAILPLHTWLPSTYRTAHPTTTALLAAVVLKLGFFGFFRLALPLVPVATNFYGPMILGLLGALAIVYGAMAALAQSDIRLILAYSSLSHAGFISLGMFSLNEEGMVGAALQMFNHGITTAALFLLAGAVIARVGTGEIKTFERGLAAVYPLLGCLFLFFTFAGAGMPGLNNFVGELLTLSGMMSRRPVLAIVGVLGVVLGAWYGLRLARQLMFGSQVTGSKQVKLRSEQDLHSHETITLAALASLSLALGCYPQAAVNFIKPDLVPLANLYVQMAPQQPAGDNAILDRNAPRLTDRQLAGLESTEMPLR